MRAYADTSFILRLVTGESGTEMAVASFRRLGRPPLFYLALHALEAENAIRQRAFHQRKVLPMKERRLIKRECETALSRLSLLQERGALLEVALDMEVAMNRARELSQTHTNRLGVRAIDLLHVGCAILLQSEIFLTFDERQGKLAKAVGLGCPL